MRARFSLAIAALTVSGGLLSVAPPAGAVSTAQPTLVSAAPGNNTPNIADKHVEEITQVGNKVILGGNFTSVTDAGSTTALSRKGILAFDATTGKVDTGFVPLLNGQVNALLPGPTAGTVYVGGLFTTLNGAAVPKLALVDTTTGAKVSTFKPPALNGIVGDIKRVGNRLYVGGAFTKAGTAAHGGLVTLNATTGALDPFMNIQVAGHHNYNGSGANGAVGVTKLDINPAGTRLVAIGNFKTVSDPDHALPGTDHDQIAMLDLTGTGAALAPWQTNRYDAACFSNAYDSYVRDVDFSPDGSYFVTVATGGYPGYQVQNNLCDAAARWETAATGSNLDPTWVDFTGGDTLLSVVVTGPAIYVGGHQRWLNNSFASDAPGPGSVPRAGLAALDPVNGLPLSWNPGRNPRGAGAYALFASPTGLYVGSDTDSIGVGKAKVTRKKIAYFPLAGGKALPSDNTGTLPATVYQAGQLPGTTPYNVLYRVNEGGPALQSVDGGPNWSGDDESINDAIRNSGSNTAGYNPSAARGAALPASTPTALFDSERWSPGGPEMQFHFAVPTGVPLKVRLYFANRCGCTSAAGTRQFNVTLDGTPVLRNYDIVADVGDQVATVREFITPAQADGSVNIDFGHAIENPLINGIEIIRTDQPDPPASQAGGNDLISRTFDGTNAGSPTTSTASGINWSHARGAFMVGGTLFYGWDDGTLHRRPFNGNTFGAEVPLSPYHDPLWMNVPNGSNGTYDGAVPNLYGEMGNVTGMFYSGGRLYYTLFGHGELYNRYFSPESGIVGSEEFTGDAGGINWSDTAGLFLDAAHGNLYSASAADGSLRQVGWDNSSPVAGQPAAGRPTGVQSAVSSQSQDWRARGLFNYAAS